MKQEMNSVSLVVIQWPIYEDTAFNQKNQPVNETEGAGSVEEVIGDREEQNTYCMSAEILKDKSLIQAWYSGVGLSS